jgi:hypothetical protein
MSLFTKHDQVVKEVPEEMYRVSFEDVGPMTLKKQRGIKYGIGEISNWVTKYIMLLNNPEAAIKAFKANGWHAGSNKVYTGLTLQQSDIIEKYKSEITKAQVCSVSYRLDKKCIAEFQTCVWSINNVQKFLKDMIKVGRLYQEKTIDYAKKISFLDIIPSSMRFITLLSLKEFGVRLVDEKVVIDLPFYEEDEDHIVVDDIINTTRKQFAEEYKEYIEETIIPELHNAKLPGNMDAELQRLRYSTDVAAFIDMKTYYKDIVGGFMRVKIEENEDESVDIASEAFKDDKSRIENMIRLATRYMTDEQRGSYMKYVAGRTKGNQKREDGENRFYLSLCREEFLKWLISLGLNDIDCAGYKLLGNKGYKPGDEVWFDNGMAGKAILDGQYTGLLTIKDIDGVLYGTVDVNDLITVPEVNNKIIMKVKQSFINKYGAAAVIRAINMASDIKFRTGGNYDIEVLCSDGKTRNIPYDFNKTFFDMFKGITGKITKVSRNVVKTMTGSHIESVYVSIDLDSIPDVIIPTGSNLNEIEEPMEMVIEESDEI